MIREQTIAVFCCCGYKEPLPEIPKGMDTPMMYGKGLFGHDYQYLTRCPNFPDECDDMYPNVDTDVRILIQK